MPDLATWGEVLRIVWPWLVALAHAAVAVVGAAHVILNKRDVRAAIGWTGLILFSPFVGAAAYYLFGINRIRRRAARLKGSGRLPGSRDDSLARRISQSQPEYLKTLNHTVHGVTGVPLTFGNSVDPLINGDQAYPAMLQAIREAEHSVALATYIFDNDRAGQRFVEVLRDAVARGVEVRVLIDGIGARYSRPPITDLLRDCGIRVAQFLPSSLPWRNPYMNLRSHRKILVVDRSVAFTGGLNIREGNLLDEPSRHPIQDIHFRLCGPVVEHIFDVFCEDWVFCTQERLGGMGWKRADERAGTVSARGIPDGPDEDFETIRWTIQAALCAAQESIRIATPYFLPDATLVTNLKLAAMRGVQVDILLPAVNNLRFVQWASTAQLWPFLDTSSRIWLNPPPFDHSKILVVDGRWSLIGSANWDARSLRLNFELDVECYDETLARSLMDYTDEKIARSRPLSRRELESRSLTIRLRDGVSRLFSPYL